MINSAARSAYKGQIDAEFKQRELENDDLAAGQRTLERIRRSGGGERTLNGLSVPDYTKQQQRQRDEMTARAAKDLGRTTMRGAEGGLEWGESDDYVKQAREQEREKNRQKMLEDRQKAADAEAQRAEDAIRDQKARAEFERGAYKPKTDIQRERLDEKLRQTEAAAKAALGDDLDAARSESPDHPAIKDLDRLRGEIAADDEQRQGYESADARARAEEAKLLGIDKPRMDAFQATAQAGELEREIGLAHSGVIAAAQGIQDLEESHQQKIQGLRDGYRQRTAQGMTAFEMEDAKTALHAAELEAEKTYQQKRRALEDAEDAAKIDLEWTKKQADQFNAQEKEAIQTVQAPPIKLPEDGNLIPVSKEGDKLGKATGERFAINAQMRGAAEARQTANELANGQEMGWIFDRIKSGEISADEGRALYSKQMAKADEAAQAATEATNLAIGDAITAAIAGTISEQELGAVYESIGLTQADAAAGLQATKDEQAKIDQAIESAAKFALDEYSENYTDHLTLGGKVKDSYEAWYKGVDDAVRQQLVDAGITDEIGLRQLVGSIRRSAEENRTKRAGDAWRESRWKHLWAFTKTADDAIYYANLKTTIDKVQEGLPLSFWEVDQMQGFLREQTRDSEATIGAKILGGVWQMPSFMGEFMLSGGIGKGASEATEKGVKELLEKVGEKQVAKYLKKYVTGQGLAGFSKKFASKAAAKAVEASIRFPASMGARVVAGTIENVARDQMFNDEGMARIGFDADGQAQVLEAIPQVENLIGPALAHSVGDNYIEMLSELSGGALTMTAAPLRKKMLATAWAQAFAKKTAALGIKPDKIARAMQAVGYHGIAEEFFEEQVGRALRMATGIEELRMPTLEELAVELAVVSVPGGAFAVANEAMVRTQNASADRQLAEARRNTALPASAAEAAEKANAFAAKAGVPVQVDAYTAELAQDIIGRDGSPGTRQIDSTIAALESMAKGAPLNERAQITRQMAALESQRADRYSADMLSAAGVAQEIEAERAGGVAMRESAQNDAEMVEANGKVRIADLASAAIKIGAGQEMEALTSAEQAALAQPMPSGNPPVDLSGGTAIVGDELRDAVLKAFPGAERFLRMTETQARQFFAGRQKAAEAKAAQPKESPKGEESPAPAAGGQGVSAEPAGAAAATGAPAPATDGGYWMAQGQGGTKVRIPAKGIGSQIQAEEALAAKLPRGEMLDRDSVEQVAPKPKVAPEITLPRNATWTNRGQKAPVLITRKKTDAQGNTIYIDEMGRGHKSEDLEFNDSPVAAKRPPTRVTAENFVSEAEKEIAQTLPKPLRDPAMWSVDQIAPLIPAYEKVFEGGVRLVGPMRGGGGFQYDPATRSLDISLETLTQTVAKQNARENWIRAALREELIHRVAAETIPEAQVKQLWIDLGNSAGGKKLQRIVTEAYFAGARPSHPDPYQMGHEFLRMIVQDAKFAGQITEMQDLDPTMKGRIIRLLRQLAKALNRAVERVPAELRAEIEQYQALIGERLDQLTGKTAAKEDAAQKQREIEARKAERERKRAEAQAKKLAAEQAAAKGEIKPRSRKQKELLDWAKANNVTIEREGDQWAVSQPGRETRLFEKPGQVFQSLRGRKEKRTFSIPYAPSGAEDIIDKIVAMGGIKPKAEMRHRQGEYDDAPELRGIYGQIVQGTLTPDKAATALGMEIPAMWAEVGAAIDRRTGAVREPDAEDAYYQKRIEETEAQDEQFAKDNKPGKGKRAIPVSSLKVGDQVELDGHPLTVISIDPDTEDVTLEDGKTYGLQRLEDGDLIYAQKADIAEPASDFLPDEDGATPFDEPTKPTKPAPKPKPAKAEAKPDFALEAQTDAQIQEEKRRAAEKAKTDAQKQAMQDKAAAPLRGDSSNVGQGALFTEDADLLSGPSAEQLNQAPTTATPTENDAADDALAKAFEGLFAGPRPILEQQGIPADRAMAMISAAQALVEAEVRTPEALAERLEKLGKGALRQYSQAMWDFLGTVDPALRGTHDWNQIYGLANSPAKPDDADSKNDATRRNNNRVSRRTQPRASEQRDASEVGDLFQGAGGQLAGQDRPREQRGSGGGRNRPAADRERGGNVGGDVAAGAEKVSGEVRGGDRLGTMGIRGSRGDIGSRTSVNPDGTIKRPDRGTPERNHEFGEGDPGFPTNDAQRLEANIKALEIAATLEAEGRLATAEEKTALSKFSGWGWNKEVFNPSNPRYATERKRLAEALTEEEFKSAAAVSLFSHYTSPEIIRGMWDLAKRLGFKGGRVLETSGGAGHFFGFMPQDLADRARLTGIEIDSATGRIFKHLYPEADIRIEGFEKSRIAPGSVDLVISNFPFAKTAPFDPAYDPKTQAVPSLNLHNYFFAKSLDKVKPGGLVIAVTTSNTMEAARRQREYLASRSEFIGAIRLPNTAFQKYAKTEVVTDIIVLRRPLGETPQGGEAWVETVPVTTDEQGREIEANEYYRDHPGMALGRHSLEGTMYRADSYALVEDGRNMGQALAKAISSFPEGIFGQESSLAENLEAQGEATAETEASYHIAGDSINQVIDGKMGPADLRKFTEAKKKKQLSPSVREKRILIAKAFIGIRDAAKEQIRLELSGADPGIVESNRVKLNTLYDRFTKKFRRPFGHAQQHHEIARFLEDDPDYDLVLALESEKKRQSKKDPNRMEVVFEKAAIFKKPILDKIVVPDRAKDIDEAVSIQLGHTTRISVPETARLLGVTEEQALDQLRASDIAMQDPVSGAFFSRSKVLSGKVRTKLKAAQQAAKEDPYFAKVAAALEKVQPKWAGIAEISVPIGARWVPGEIYEAFIASAMKSPGVSVSFNQETNSYFIEGPFSNEATTEFASIGEDGRARVTVAQTLKHAMHGTYPRITYTEKNPDGSTTTHTDEEATADARAKVDTLKETWADWYLTGDGTVTINGETAAIQDAIEEHFNEKVNGFLPPSYDGSYIPLPGISKEVYRLPHRMNAIARVIEEGGAMIAHGVGSGKTFTQIAMAMEMRRLRLAKKPLIVVQKATLGQFAKSFREAYPNAKILVASEKSFTKDHRARFFNRIATNDWDAVIVTQPQFDRIPSDPENSRRYLEGILDDLEDMIRDNKGDDATTRQIEQAKRSVQKKMDRTLNALSSKADESLFFEQMGVDALMIDEAHAYKAAPIVTNLSGIKGVPNTESQRAINLEVKARFIHGKTNGRNVILATGTPITNTMAEAFIMQRLASPRTLQAFGIENFDDFATMFGRTNSDVEATWSGKLKEVTRFNRFTNGKQLASFIRGGFDVALGNEKLGLKVPKLKGDAPENVLVENTASVKRIIDWIFQIGDKFESLSGKARRDYTFVPIFAMQVGKAAAIDPRLVDPGSADEPNSKVNAMVDRAIKIYRGGQERKTTQLIFSDMYRPMDLEKLEAFGGQIRTDKNQRYLGKETQQALERAGVPESKIEQWLYYDSDSELEGDWKNFVKKVEKAGFSKRILPDLRDFQAGFNLYGDIRQKLIAKGVKPEEIAIINDFNTDKKREELFDKVNDGAVRILIGSTQKMGVGVNVQTRLAASHNLDPPWTPALMEQRDGRIIRQKNLHYDWGERIEILRYAVTGSLDAALYQILEAKQYLITQALNGDIEGEFEDAAASASMDFAMMKASIIGDPRLIRQIVLRGVIKKLENEQAGFRRSQSTKVKMLNQARASIPKMEEDLANRQAILRQWEAAGDGYTIESKHATAAAGNRESFDSAFRKLTRATLEGYARGNEIEFTHNFKINGIDASISAQVGSAVGSDISLKLMLPGVENEITESNTPAAILGRYGNRLKSNVEKLKEDLEDKRGMIEPLVKAAGQKWAKKSELDAAIQEYADLKNQMTESAEKEGKALFAGARPGAIYVSEPVRDEADSPDEPPLHRVIVGPSPDGRDAAFVSESSDAPTRASLRDLAKQNGFPKGFSIKRVSAKEYNSIYNATFPALYAGARVTPEQDAAMKKSSFSIAPPPTDALAPKGVWYRGDQKATFSPGSGHRGHIAGIGYFTNSQFAAWSYATHRGIGEVHPEEVRQKAGLDDGLITRIKVSPKKTLKNSGVKVSDLKKAVESLGMDFGEFLGLEWNDWDGEGYYNDYDLVNADDFAQDLLLENDWFVGNDTDALSSSPALRVVFADPEVGEAYLKQGGFDSVQYVDSEVSGWLSDEGPEIEAETLVVVSKDIIESESIIDLSESDLGEVEAAAAEITGATFSIGGATAASDSMLRASKPVTPEQDAEYMAAVGRGDMEAAQRMVDEAAKAAGFNEKGSHGLSLGKLDGDTFDKTKLGSFTRAPSATLGFFFASPETAKSYGLKSFNDDQLNAVVSEATEVIAPLIRAIPDGVSRMLDFERDLIDAGTAFSPESVDRPEDFVSSTFDYLEEILNEVEFYADELSNEQEILDLVESAKKRLESGIGEMDFESVYDSAMIDARLKMEYPLIHDQQGARYREESFFDIITKAKKQGHDSVIIKNTFDGGPKDDVKVVFEPSQIKSADPVTRDTGGNVIPLSQRFNPDSDSILYAGSRDPFEAIRRLEAEMEANLPTEIEMASIRARALGEKFGERTAGDPDLANPAATEETRREFDAVREARRLRMEAETHEEWNEEARKRIAKDRGGFLAQILDKIAEGQTLDKIEVKGAQMLVAGEMAAAVASRDYDRLKRAQALAYAYDKSGTEQGRAFAARRDPHKTRSARNLEFVAKTILKPTAEEEKRAADLPTEAQKAREIARLEQQIKAAEGDKRRIRQLERELKDAKAQQAREGMLADAAEARLDKIEEQFAKMGISLHDIFNNRAVVRLRGSAIVKGVLEAFAPKERSALRLMVDGVGNRRIAKETGIGRKALEGVEDRFDAAMREELGKWVDRGFTLADFELLDEGGQFDLSQVVDEGGALRAGPRPQNAEERQKRIDEIMKALKPTREARNSGRIKRFKKKAGAGYGFDPDSQIHAVQAARAANAIANANRFDMAFEWWVNGILSGPQTHVANITGNFTSAAWDMTVQRGMEALVNGLVFRDKSAAQFGEIPIMWKSLLAAIPKAWRMASQSYGSEVDLFSSTYMDEPVSLMGDDKAGNVRGAIPGRLGRVVRIPGRALLLMDAFFKTAIAEGEVAAQAYRIAKADGLEGAEMEDRITQLINTPVSAAWVAAVDKAKELTFTNELRSFQEGGGIAESIVKRIQDGRNSRTIAPAGRFVIGLIFPFIRTPFRIFQMGLRKSPLGSIHMSNQMVRGLYRMRNGVPFFESYPKALMAKHLSEQILGGVALAFLWGAIEGDPDDDDKPLLITGNRPFKGMESGERDLETRRHGGANQIIIGGKDGLRIDYGRIEPLATLLGTTVDMIRGVKDMEHGKDKAEAIGQQFQFFLAQSQDKTFLQGLAKIGMLFMTGGANLADEAKKTVLQGAIPNIIRQPMRNLDPVARDTKNAPFWYQMLPYGGFAEPAYDLYGQPMEKEGSGIARTVLDLPLKPAPDAPADQAIRNYALQNPDESYFPGRNFSIDKFKDPATGEWVDMNAAEIAELNRVAGRKFANEARAIFPPGTDAKPTAEQMERLQSARKRIWRETRDQMFRYGRPKPRPKKELKLTDALRAAS